MPLLNIKTNTSTNDEKSLALQASKMVADMLGKPESYVMVNVQTEQTLVFAGSDEPAAYLELKSLGLPDSKTAEFSAALCKFINTTLGINPNRIYIEFSNPERHMWGWNNATF